MTHSSPPFTAAQIARVLCKSKRSIWRLLESVPPTSTLPVNGGEAAGWSIEALPLSLQTALASEAGRRGCRDVAALLHYAPAPWQPPVPMSQVPQKFLDRAARLRDALAEPLRRQHELASAELRTLGLDLFSRHLGYTISAKQWNRIFERAILRDAGAENWARLELYIDEAAFPRSRPIVRVKTSFSLQPINDAIAGLENHLKPTAEDVAWLFHNVFRHFELIALQGLPARQVKSTILDHLHSRFGSALCKSSASLRRTFDNKFAAWKLGGRTHEAITDKRPARSGSPSYSCPACEEKVNHQARHLRGNGGTKGNTSLAWRLLWNDGQICPVCMERYSFDMRKNKSYVPRNFRRRAAPRKLEIASDRGWKHARSIGPYIAGDYTGFEPGVSYVFDDETPNQVCFDYVEGELLIGVAQNIEGIDSRCDMPLEFYMYIGAPSALAIRRAMKGVFLKVGLPDEEVLLENGVFAARMIIGEDQPSWRETAAEFESKLGLKIEAAPDREPVRGIKEAGVGIHHATTPSGKPIEGYFNHTQKRASLLPGTAGNRQRDEIPDRLKEFVARCKAGKEDPRTELLSLEELRKNYRAIRQEHMNTPQNGKRLRGATPLEMWSERLSRKPLRKLPPEMEYLVSTHKQIRRIGEHGIELAISKYEKALYASSELGAWYGKRVREALVFSDIFDRSHITVSDMNRQNFLSVPRIILPKRNAPKQDIAEAHRHTRGFIAEATGGFGKLTHPLSHTIVRDDDHTEAQKELGRFHNAAVEQRKAEETEEQRMFREIRRLETTLGEPARDLNTCRRPGQYLESLRWKAEQRDCLSEEPELNPEA